MGVASGNDAESRRVSCEGAVRLLQPDSQRVPAGDDSEGRVGLPVDHLLRADDVVEVRGDPGLHLRVEQAVDRVREGSRRHRRAGREAKALPDRERVRLAPVRDASGSRWRSRARCGAPPAAACRGSSIVRRRSRERARSARGGWKRQDRSSRTACGMPTRNVPPSLIPRGLPAAARSSAAPTTSPARVRALRTVCGMVRARRPPVKAHAASWGGRESQARASSSGSQPAFSARGWGSNRSPARCSMPQIT